MVLLGVIKYIENKYGKEKLEEVDYIAAGRGYDLVKDWIHLGTKRGAFYKTIEKCLLSLYQELFVQGYRNTDNNRD